MYGAPPSQLVYAVPEGAWVDSSAPERLRRRSSSSSESERDASDEQEETETVRGPEFYAAWLQEATRADPTLFVRLIMSGEGAKLVELMNSALRRLVNFDVETRN